MTAALSTPVAAAPAAPASHAMPVKVVVQVSDASPGTWKLALNNLRNAQRALGAQNIDAELVVYGPGIDMLRRESVVEPIVTQVLGEGVRVVACQNTMRGHHLTEADMIAGIGYVPSGVVEIIEREREGFAYLRP